MGEISNLSYNLFMFPFEAAILNRFRKNAIRQAKGRVLEIGAGTGVNFRFYDSSKVKSLTIFDKAIREFNGRFSTERFSDTEMIEGDAESLPFEDGSFDTVVFTLVFCSVADPMKGLLEVRRVLKDNGRAVFIEHVIPEKRVMKAVVEKFNPLWRSFSDGCNLNRSTLDTIKAAGFDIIDNTYDRKGIFITGIAEKTVME